MAEFNWADLTKAADDAGFGVLPAGPYDVYVAKAEAKKTSTGKDQIAVQFKVENGPHQGKSIFNNFVLSPENGTALGFFFRHMKAMGLDGAYFASNPALAAVAANLVNRRCQVAVTIRQWNDEDRNQVDRISPPLDGQSMVSGAPGGGPSVMGGPIPGAVPMPSPAPAPAPVAAPRPAPAPVPAPAPAPAPVVKDTTSDADVQDEITPPGLPF